MSHHTPLISMIVIGLVLAFALGALAHRFRISPLVGYLVAGVLVGPFTPGFVADQGMAHELAEIGVILLMFGVGLHFSLQDLLSVRAIAIPGAVFQIATATLLGMGLAWWLGWPVGAGIVFGLALSVASTVVLLRALQERRLLETDRGRIAVGWLIVEDIAMVLTLVMLPALAPAFTAAAGAYNWSALVAPLLITIAKVAAFVAIMLIVGKRVIPWLLHYVAHTGSRELFRLAVLAIALGCAFGAAMLFDVSFALGAFFAGMIMSESELSQRAANETLPLRDAFAVLFFVSVGMLVDPLIVVREPVAVLATVLIIVLGKSIAAYAIVRMFRHPHSTALTISASLAQIGEFSFILAGLGVALALLPEPGRDLILAGAIISILLNPLFFAGLDHILARKPAAAPAVAPDVTPEPAEEPAREEIPLTTLTDHVVLVGYGRVGKFIAEQLSITGVPLLFVEEDADRAAKLKSEGKATIAGNAADPEVIRAANPAVARCVLVAIPDAFEGGQVVAQARETSASLLIIARAHSEAEIEHLKKHGASQVIMGEHEIAKAMIAAIPPTPPAGSATAEPSPPVAPT
ncbi:MAG: Kef family K(+) transporter [Rhizobiales bacterium]|nr:Kef family K(+) transporter [Hyphomicrobiales bacterium]